MDDSNGTPKSARIIDLEAEIRRREEEAALAAQQRKQRTLPALRPQFSGVYDPELFDAPSPIPAEPLSPFRDERRKGYSVFHLLYRPHLPDCAVMDNAIVCALASDQTYEKLQTHKGKWLTGMLDGGKHRTRVLTLGSQLQEAYRAEITAVTTLLGQRARAGGWFYNDHPNFNHCLVNFEVNVTSAFGRPEKWLYDTGTMDIARDNHGLIIGKGPKPA